MDRSTFDAIDSLIEDVADLLEKLLESETGGLLKEKLVAINAISGAQRSVTLDFRVEVFEEDRTGTLPLLSTGLACSSDGTPYRTWNDSTPQRYLLNGEMLVVPHDYCPACWGLWDFKFENPQCPECGIKLGDDVKVLLDSDVCPHCERGKVGVDHPKCTECGYEVNLRYVAWG